MNTAVSSCAPLDDEIRSVTQEGKRNECYRNLASVDVGRRAVWPVVRWCGNNIAISGSDGDVYST